MATFVFWRNVIPGTGIDPPDDIQRYTYDTSDDSITADFFTVPAGSLGPIHPPVGTVVYQECQGLDMAQFLSTGSEFSMNKVVLVDSPGCCTLNASEFSVVRTNNTNLLTPNGTITVTTVPTPGDIGNFQASINGGVNYFTQVDNEIVFTGLPAGNYDVIIKALSGVCSVTVGVNIIDNITYPPLIISEHTQPALYSPVFYPITIGFLLDNNTATIKSDVNGTYLEVGTADGREYLATLPIIKIIDNEDYAGTYQINSVDDVDTPTKFYFTGTYTTDQAALFVPFDRQVFQLFAETSFNNYQKIADIRVYPDETGEYLLRLEGFLQAVFAVNQPINDGDEITLLRKYYVVPRDFDMEDANTIYNAVYSAVPDLTLFLFPLTPLGPAPINFINEQTQKGFPVLFSYIDTTVGRVKNILSSQQTEVVSTLPTIYIPGLVLNQYDVTWINPLGAIGALNVTPALPTWITLEASPSDTVQLTIDTGSGTTVGDYDPDDYDSDDYLTAGTGPVIGCYTFEFFDGITPLFTLQICIFPTQNVNAVCAADDSFNIAWINRQGGWSSYVFEGKKTYGVDIDEVTTYKKGHQLKRSTVDNVYDTVEVNVGNKSILDMIFIGSLKQSIQAFLWSNQTLQFSIPIVLDKQSFATHSTPFKQIEVNDKFVFRYAEEVVIQSQ